ncbi:MAG: flagellar biosynthesis anti-sigma factor FlgM [Polyangiaceae bacterium]
MAISPVGGARPVERPEAAPSGGPSASAEVSISARARDLASEANKIDTVKVEGLKQQIAAGKYQTDSHAIAQKDDRTTRITRAQRSSSIIRSRVVP